MTPEDLAALHRRCFSEAPAPWSAAAFSETLAFPSTVALLRPSGVAIGRVVGPEAELLTLAVAPEARRHGLGRALLMGFEAAARERGAMECFLEVADANAAACALYAASGYVPAGRRRGAYARPPRPPLDAIVMRKAFPAGSGPACEIA